MKGKRQTPIADRFWAKVEQTDGCWGWTGSIDETGYGRIYANGLRYPAYAHRVSHELSIGPIPTGLIVDHACRNRQCANPSHLRLVTPKQNNENHSGAQRNSKTGVRGVTVSRSGKFVAKVNSNGRVCFQGTFATLSEAEAVVTAKRNELFTHNDTDRSAA